MPVGEMALLLFTCNPLSSLPSSSTALPITAHTFSSSCNNSVFLKPKSYVGYRILTPFILKERGALIVKASSDVDGVGSTDPKSPAPPSESNEENVPIENLPLESKLQLKLEQKMRMKAAKED
ncbi:50S ribosomal protein 5 alpha [Forsythia ovata]|uniref:50S ribosomal protein 5 alpha n=1 Tax=Forsythia ovata TaxID=205694 RepID=A0ABD1PMG2_9LAMI